MNLDLNLKKFKKGCGKLALKLLHAKSLDEVTAIAMRHVKISEKIYELRKE